MSAKRLPTHDLAELARWAGSLGLTWSRLGSGHIAFANSCGERCVLPATARAFSVKRERAKLARLAGRAGDARA